MKQQVPPLEVCFRLIGPHAVIADIIGYGPTAPYLWERGARNRDAGDLPSTPIMRALLAHSATRQLGLTADHLIWGATEAEIAEILAARAMQAVAAPTFTSRREVAA
jgi:hypothetical protein